MSPVCRRGSSALVVGALAGAASAASLPPPSEWTHDWATGAGMMWADVSTNGNLTTNEADDLAARYRILSLEQCFGMQWDHMQEDDEALAAAAARALKTAAKTAGTTPPAVLLYTNLQCPRACYASDAEYMANPEWWLRFDHGAWAGLPLMRDRTPPPMVAKPNAWYSDKTFMDPRNASAREWFVGHAARLGTDDVFDGLYVDGAGWMDWYDNRAGNVTRQATQEINASRLALLTEARTKGAVIYNGVTDTSQYCPDDCADDATWEATDGADIEHFGAFECIAPDGGAISTFIVLSCSIERIGML